MKNKKSIFGIATIKGQITIFIILTFQVLFVFLVMMINIGFVVHDKINLQNSVDLGVIYGAQKQAEILDAMAHINYQIRQSYKLLAWRYLVLGQLGANYGKDGRSSSALANYRIQGGLNSDDQLACTELRKSCEGKTLNCEEGDLDNMQECPIATCMWHPEWKFPISGGNNDHVCQKSDRRGAGGGNIFLPNPSDYSSSAGNLFLLGRDALQTVTQAARTSITNSCEGLGLLNWLMASSFLYQFRYDQWQRRTLIEDLFNRLLKLKRDLDGHPIEDGIKNTIQNNLTKNNHEAWKNNTPEIIIQSTADGKSFNDFFTWNEITPILFYIKNRNSDSISANTVCPSYPLPIFNKPTGYESAQHKHLLASNLLYTNIQSPAPFAHNDPPLSGIDAEWFFIPLVSGFYKKQEPPPQPIAIKVSVSLKYKNKIFSPFTRTIPLKALAYAKPFGAKFGPPPLADPRLPMSSDFSFAPPSDDSEHTIYEPLLPFRPNYSKYPGDQYGLLSQAVQSQWVHRLVAGEPGGDGRRSSNYEVSTQTPDPMVHIYKQVGTDYELNHADTRETVIRKQEELAIAPDLFDITYYTILPNYMATLFTRIRNNRDIGQAIRNATGYLPGDLGDLKNYAEDGDPPPLPDNFRNCFRYFEKDGDKYVLPSGGGGNDINAQGCIIGSFLADRKPQLPYKITNINHFLTSWTSPKDFYQDDPYNQEHYPNNIINNCEQQDTAHLEGKPLLPHSCLVGGRSGFSVKLIDKQCYTQSDCSL